MNEFVPGVEVRMSRGQAVRLAVLCLGVWLHAASSMLAATTLPSAVREIGGGGLIGWAFALYLLGSILAGAGAGMLSRYAQLKTGLIGAGGIYLLGCSIAALAPNMVVVLVGRLTQGVGGGFMVALTYVALNRWFNEAVLVRLLAVVSAVWSVSALSGPLVGGTFSTIGQWRWAFWAFALQAAVFIAACVFLMPSEPEPDRGRSATSFPLARLGVLSLSVLAVAFAGARVDAIVSPMLCVAGAVLLWAVFRLDAKQLSNRIFPRSPMNPRQPVGVGLVFVLAGSFSTMSFLVYGPLLLETLHGVSPLTAGYIVAIESIAWGAAAIAVSRCAESLESILIRSGSTLITAGVAGFALLMANGPLWMIIACAVAQGAGFGMSWGYVVKGVIGGAEPDDREVAASAVPTLQQIGFAIGAVAAGIVANGLGFGDDVTISTAKSAAPWISGAFIPTALAAALAAWRLSASRPSALPEPTVA